MTLPNVAFFPQALMPLHIFEPRYRQMLKESLATHRLFAVAGIDPKRAEDATQFEPAHRIATVGIVRACQKAENGTSNLLLQGLARIEFTEIIREHPYRIARMHALTSEPGAPDPENLRLRTDLAKLIVTKQRLGGTVPPDFAKFLKTIEDPETFVDLAAFSLCEDPSLKQQLLETLDVHHRLQLFTRQMRTEIETIKLRRKLQGHLADDHISDN
ncbi:MAG: LON peptidase substrate-binding domain-containing protein [Nibricoccus sp.]